MASNWRSEMSLQDYLVARSVVAIAEIDTRKLTRVLRDQGSQNGAIVAGQTFQKVHLRALRRRKALPGLRVWIWRKLLRHLCPMSGRKEAGRSGRDTRRQNTEFHVVAYDFGVKKNILRMLADRAAG